jgi:ribonuclease T2
MLWGMRSARIAGLVAALLTAGGALAECAAFGPRPYARGGGEHAQAGVFDYYVLSLSWSPSYCAGEGAARAEAQCQRRFAFVLHGLWPQFERGWPQDCPSPDHGFVPRSVAEGMRDIMPSDRLIFHTYRKHGTCSGLGPAGYFYLARRLFDRVRIPARFQNFADERLTMTPGEIVGEFLASNPELTAQMIAVTCGGAGNRLQEVRICFDRESRPRACGSNETQRRLCHAARVYIPPVRPAATPRDDSAPLLPGPRGD